MNEIIVPAKIEYLENVMYFMKDCLREYSTEGIKYSLELGVEEIFTNIVNYAYINETGQVWVQCKTEQNPSRCRITFKDQGIPFNPLERDDPDLEVPIEERPIGGLGIFLIRKLFDEVIYEYKNKYNNLTITKML